MKNASLLLVVVVGATFCSATQQDRGVSTNPDSIN
jgi:hypothetical protein